MHRWRHVWDYVSKNPLISGALLLLVPTAWAAWKWDYLMAPALAAAHYLTAPIAVPRLGLLIIVLVGGLLVRLIGARRKGPKLIGRGTGGGGNNSLRYSFIGFSNLPTAQDPAMIVSARLYDRATGKYLHPALIWHAANGPLDRVTIEPGGNRTLYLFVQESAEDHSYIFTRACVNLRNLPPDLTRLSPDTKKYEVHLDDGAGRRYKFAINKTQQHSIAFDFKLRMTDRWERMRDGLRQIASAFHAR